ncbi:MAG: hypothetical protein ACRENE_17350 [Polyangiaceae bacterium]
MGVPIASPQWMHRFGTKMPSPKRLFEKNSSRQRGQGNRYNRLMVSMITTTTGTSAIATTGFLPK